MFPRRKLTVCAEPSGHRISRFSPCIISQAPSVINQPSVKQRDPDGRGPLPTFCLLPWPSTDRSHLFCGCVPRALLAVCSMACSSLLRRTTVHPGRARLAKQGKGLEVDVPQHRIQGLRRLSMPAWTYGRLSRQQLHGQHHGCLARSITFLQLSPNGSAWAEGGLDRDISSYVTAKPGAVAFLWQRPGTVRAARASKADPCRSVFEEPAAVRTTDDMVHWNFMVIPVGETTRWLLLTLLHLTRQHTSEKDGEARGCGLSSGIARLSRLK